MLLARSSVRPAGRGPSIGRSAEVDAVLGQTQHPRGSLGHHLVGQPELVVVAEVGAIADQHGALQHVAVAERRPGIADIVRAAEHFDPVRAQQRQRRHGRGARAVAHDRDA